MNDIMMRIDVCINEYYYLQLERAYLKLMNVEERFEELFIRNSEIENELELYDMLENITVGCEKLSDLSNAELILEYIKNKTILDSLSHKEMFKLGYQEGLLENNIAERID